MGQWQRTESELAWWFGERDASIGLSGSGFEGGAVSVWDEARSARVHGFHVEEGRLLIAQSGKTSRSHRMGVERERKVRETMTDLSAADTNIAAAAWSTCNASTYVMNYFASQTYDAPMVGLALVAWYELKNDETRAPFAVVSAWTEIITKNTSALGRIKTLAGQKYWPTLARYEARRLQREDVAGESRRARAQKKQSQNEVLRAILRGMQ